MFRNLVQLYSMMVCFVSSIIMIILAAIFINSLFKFYFTEIANISSMEAYETNENYIDYYKYEKEKQQTFAALPNDELSSIRLNAKAKFIRNNKNSSLSTMIELLGWSVSALFAFIIHWFMYKKSK